MSRLSEIFAEDNAQGGSESESLEERVLKIEEMLTKLTEALIDTDTTETDETDETDETVEVEEKEETTEKVESEDE